MTIAPVLMKLDLQTELAEQLNIEEAFSFKIGTVEIGFDESTVVMWIIMAAMTVLAVFLTRGFKVEGKISRRQAFVELCYVKGEAFFKGLMGERAHRYIPWLMSMALMIGVSNIIGLFGMKPPTKSMQVTAAMALTSIVLVEYSAFREKGFLGRLKAFANPIWIITPINLMEIIIKPLSLCMRLFGNVLAAFTIMELIKAVVPWVIPVALSLYFDIFDGLLQAYVFVFLTALYINEAVEEEEQNAEKAQKKLEKASRKAEKKAKKQAKKTA